MSEVIEAILWLVLLFVGLTGFYVLASYSVSIRQQLGAAGAVVLCLFVFAMLPLLSGLWYLAAYGLQYVGIIFFAIGFFGVFADAGLLLWCMKNSRAFTPKPGKSTE